MNKRNGRYSPYNPSSEYSTEPDIKTDGEVESVEETASIEVPQDEEPIEIGVVEQAESVNEPVLSEKDVAMKLIAGEFGSEEPDIRKALSEQGFDYDEITDVKKRILVGTYFSAE